MRFLKCYVHRPLNEENEECMIFWWVVDVYVAALVSKGVLVIMLVVVLLFIKS